MNQKYNALILFLCLTLIAFSSCRDKNGKDDPPPVKMEFPGIIFTDEYGYMLGAYGGTDDNDWKYDQSWPPEIADLMNYPDTISLSGTFLDPEFIPGQDLLHLSFFPNPVADLASVYIILPGQVKVKLALVDHYLNPVLNLSYLDRDTSWLWLDLSDSSRFVEGEVYRMYYSLSVDGNDNFYQGHGDVLICKDRPQNTCLRFIE